MTENIDPIATKLDKTSQYYVSIKGEEVFFKITDIVYDDEAKPEKLVLLFGTPIPYREHFPKK